MEASALIKGSKNTALAKKVMDWAASKSANELYSKYYALVAHPEVKNLPKNYPEAAETRWPRSTCRPWPTTARRSSPSGSSATRAKPHRSKDCALSPFFTGRGRPRTLDPGRGGGWLGTSSIRWQTVRRVRVARSPPVGRPPLAAPLPVKHGERESSDPMADILPTRSVDAAVAGIDPHPHPQSDQALRRLHGAEDDLARHRTNPSSSASSGPRVAARRPCCAPSPALIRRTRAPSRSPAATSRACRLPRAISASCFSPTRCFPT